LMTRHMRPLVTATVAAAAMLIAIPALAGPPLLCHPFDIGAARSLPMGQGGWQIVDRDYDTSRLVDDTLGLLGPSTSVTVRMETIRRATIYASNHPAQANALLTALEDRARNPPAAFAALAVFDFGYLVETYKEAQYMFKQPIPAINRIDGHQLVLKAHALQSDAEMRYAAKLILDGRPATATK
jgi:hypothetical protein